MLPDRLTEVGSSAFSGGRLPADFSTGNLKIIGSRAFNVSQIRSVTLEAALDSCGSDMFELGYKDTLQVLNYKVPNLRTTSGFDFNIAQVNIAANVEYLPMGLFNGVDCKVHFEPRTAMGNEKNTHLLIDEQCFAHNDSLTSLVLPDCRTAIGASAFQNCSKLTHLHLGEGTENIDALAFENCRNLKNIDLPPTLPALGYDAFYINTYSSEDSIQVFFHSPEPPQMNPNVFSSHRSTIFYVPTTSIDAYSQIAALDPTQHDYFKIRPYGIASLTLNKEQFALETVGMTETLTAQVASDLYNAMTLRWTSSNADVATVDSQGKVTATGRGTAVITARLAYEPDYKARCAVYVGVPLGVDDAVADEPSFKVEVGKGRITLRNLSSNSVVRLYNSQRQMVKQSTVHTFSQLSPGIYLIAVDNQTQSVIVKNCLKFGFTYLLRFAYSLKRK